MKKIFVIVLSLLMLSFSTKAQDFEPNNEFRLSVSDGFPVSFGIGVGSAIGGAFTNKKRINGTSYGHWLLAYRNHVSSRFAVGMDVTFQHDKIDFEHKNGDTSSAKMDYFSVMPGIEFTYYRNNAITLYGNAMAGAGVLKSKTFESNGAVVDETTSKAEFAFQVNPIGLRVGKQVAVYGELGAGIKGFITLGLSAAF